MSELIKNLALFFSFYLFFFSCFSNKETSAPPELQLWYDQPAAEWTDALPIGNGRLGAMIYGGTTIEKIQFNEETVWTGRPHNYVREGAWAYLDDLRKLLWEGKQEEAHKLGNQYFMSDPLRQLSYQPFGDLNLYFPAHEKAENYRRNLNLETATAGVSYEQGGVKYTREFFSSYPDQAIFVRLKSDKKRALNFSINLSSPHRRTSRKIEEDLIILSGQVNDYPATNNSGGPAINYPPSEIRFEARLKIVPTDGEFLATDTSIAVKNATEVTLILVGATNFVNYRDISADPSSRSREILARVAPINYAKAKENHIQDYQSLYKRLNIDLGSSQLSARPTNLRLENFYEDQDPNLVALLFQYGRYLLISSSRPGTQAANLQGIWNDRLSPPWDSKYTANINLEMNYWPAEATNLIECAEPLFEMTKDLTLTGRDVAREHYQMNGWLFHHNTDVWRGAAPINNANHGIWVTGGAWICQHLWRHYQYTGDRDFLKNDAYPIMKEAAIFFTEYLTPDKNRPDWLISGPSNSPENGGLVMGPTMDHQIIRNLFANTIEAAEVLGLDAKLTAELKNKRAKIAPNQIGQYGQLQEWLEDKDDPENKHRHVSHLWGLHPGNEIHPLTTPDLADACKVSLSHRGDGGTGWSRAWKINFWARLLDGDHAFLMLKNLIVPAGTEKLDYENKGGLYRNLFDAHPPFQIDGNFGAASGITEMILQSHLRDENGNYYLDLLPALPDALPDGKISGLRARGGFELDLEWEKGALTKFSLYAITGGETTLRYRNKTLSVNLQKNDRLNIKTTSNGFKIE